ncbi:MAG: 3-phosphoshikimate 1-carboxyvinyltransferase, partial [Erysipelotrichia bacterium]|nr:3-phosphoshikimate 1-carboxyvinyltransferase [Erysipelotrichia bacterium]
VMALSILTLSAKEPVIISGAEAVRKSYPGFFEDLNTLGVEAENI